MDKALQKEISILASKQKTWEPDAILFPMDCGKVVNLIDFIGSGDRKVLYFDKRPEWSDCTNKEGRKVLIQQLVNACAKTGFTISCKGWEPKRGVLRFICAAHGGRKFKSQVGKKTETASQKTDTASQTTDIASKKTDTASKTTDAASKTADSTSKTCSQRKTQENGITRPLSKMMIPPKQTVIGMATKTI